MLYQKFRPTGMPRCATDALVFFGVIDRSSTTSSTSTCIVSLQIPGSPHTRNQGKVLYWAPRFEFNATNAESKVKNPELPCSS